MAVGTSYRSFEFHAGHKLLRKFEENVIWIDKDIPYYAMENYNDKGAFMDRHLYIRNFYGIIVQIEII